MTRKKSKGMLPDFEELIPEENIENSSFSFIAEFKGNCEEEIREANIPDELPILPLRNMVLFPTTVLPISVGRESSLQLIKELEKSGGYMGVMCQREATVDTPLMEDLYPFGTVAKIVKVFEMPDNSTTVILQGYQRIQLLEITRTRPYHLGRVMPVNDIPTPHDEEFNLLIQNCRKTATKIFKANGTNPEAAFAMKNMGNDSILINFLCANIKAPLTEKIALLEEMSLKERAYHLLTILNHEKMLVDIQSRIQAKTQKDIDQQQKEYYLQQQLKNIQEELGGNPQDQDVNELRKKGGKKK
jgi:ATP-dependent Lon protease